MRLLQGDGRDAASGVVVDLAGAWLHQADLTGADLRGSDLSAVDPVANKLAKAVVDLDQAVVLVRSLGLKVEEEVPMTD